VLGSNHRHDEKVIALGEPPGDPVQSGGGSSSIRVAASNQHLGARVAQDGFRDVRQVLGEQVCSQGLGVVPTTQGDQCFGLLGGPRPRQGAA
jgi:hypothetical protein